ncbi:hypothetical protein Kpol_1064p58 [Vanderwaltozyma polyspora DSM 70294]|uniref:Regulator of V-ATPase in vacuolar membrane protein 2 n=1 Tax=Vanderwaltozyma polyspora (strain ATCC 22028 / DSM 70294 / BCRC 21397 / CBS 2163 / NBRC 10782 / NRRL Y-8283 / UCD 57-17) TaxID=436907 RepID=A7TMI2_VANPO|nr:uncharacterized protein Kpol_1064p58 [Vanderwaltozyma polyspora DSM 70294]EDO16576.1 hypothetical protein Kpol_1064p58 [Vanderwaltozyma polyspora DSM 70294]
MTTKLYPNDYFGDKTQYDFEKDKEVEKKWIIEEIIKPELPNIIDNVEKCIEMLNANQVFKMPISSGGNDTSDKPSIKGVITRQAGYILDFQVILRFPEFHKGKQVVYRMNSGSKFSLKQIHTLNDNLQALLVLLEELEMVKDTAKFNTKLEQGLTYLTKSINLLQNPSKELSFPGNNNLAMKEMFQDYQTLCESNSHLVSLELMLFKNEISIEFRNLLKVMKKPWNEIDPDTGKSITDQIKDKLKSDRGLNLANVLKDFGIQIEEPSIFNNIMMSTFNTERTTLVQAQNYLNRCVTFDNKVVMECEKLVVTTSDPSLISLCSKLNSLENSIGNHYSNLTS